VKNLGGLTKERFFAALSMTKDSRLIVIGIKTSKRKEFMANAIITGGSGKRAS
jgi:hypothetical protein